MVLFFLMRNGVTQECGCQWDINIPIYISVLQFEFRIYLTIKCLSSFALDRTNVEHLCYVTDFSSILRKQFKIIKALNIKKYWKRHVNCFWIFQIPEALIDVLLMQAVSLSSGSSPWAPTNVEGGMM